MVLEFLGADHEVTGSCHYVSVNDKHFLVDCGMQQGPDLYENQDIPVNASKIDYVFVTHAHIDHSGLLPLLYARGFRGQVFATSATCQLCDIMLKDSAHIQMSEAEWKNRKAKRSGKEIVTPMYDIQDAEGVMNHFVPCNYDEVIEISPEISIRFIDAGHLLGSASIEVWLEEEDVRKKIVFSGDIGHGNKPLIRDPQFIDDADYVLIESTYGNRCHSDPPDFAVALAEIISRTLSRGGNLVIPAFSVGRTQELLYFIRRIKEEGMLPELEGFQVFIDSPLSVEATNIYNESVADCYSDEAKQLVAQGHNPIKFDGLRVSVSSDESRMINLDPKPKVIISASGMCEAGRIRHHLKHNLWRQECTILFVGYQVPGTLGHVLLNGATEVRLFGEVVNVNADIENLPGISGHGDRTALLDWLKHFNGSPQKVFVVHGDNDVVDGFAMDVRNECGLDSYAPYSGDVFDLATGMQTKVGPRIVKQVRKSSKASSNVFARLLAAGQRLLRVIEKCEGMANKDLAKFADQINSLADKWDR